MQNDKLPHFAKGALKFIHPSFTQSHSAASLLVSSGGVGSDLQQLGPPNRVCDGLEHKRQNYNNKWLKKRCVANKRILKSVATLCVARAALCSPSPAWLLKCIYKTAHGQNGRFSLLKTFHLCAAFRFANTNTN